MSAATTAPERGSVLQSGQDVHARGMTVASLTVLVLSLLPVLLQFCLHGYSSGHDLPFHLGSWQDAARQLRHGTYPQWDFAAALGAGEPRFIFYPPLSWLLGAALSSFLTPAHAAESFILLALATSWITMFRTARRYTGSAGALLAAATYVAGPYTLYNALERSAFGELLACAWLPLLFAAVVPARDDEGSPHLRRIAIPMALLWLTNVPTAIIGSYLLVLLSVVRLLQMRGNRAGLRPATLAMRTAAGAALGLLLCSFFLVPALHQSHWVQLNSAFTEGQSYADNFLLHHTAHTRRGNIHVVSLIAAEYILPLALLLVALSVRRGLRVTTHRPFKAPLMAAAAAAVLLLLPVSAPIWKYLPELSVLQFPWRLLCVLSLVSSLALAAAAARYLRGQAVPLAAAVALAWIIGGLGAHRYWLNPDRLEVDGRLRRDDAYDEQRRPTVEYTPAGASNDELYRQTPPPANTPPYWLVNSATAPLPVYGLLHGTMAVTSSQLATQSKTQSKWTGYLVFKTRAYPLWIPEADGHAVQAIARPDGRIVIALPNGADRVDLRWHHGWDTWLGLALSVLAALCLLLLPRSFARTRDSHGYLQP